MRPSDKPRFLRSGAAPLAARIGTALAPAFRVAAALATLAVGACVSPLARSAALPDLAAIFASHPGLRTLPAEAPPTGCRSSWARSSDAGGRPRLVQHSFRAGAEYFYPASAVKLFAAVAALERWPARARDRPRRSTPTRRWSSIRSSPARPRGRATPPISTAARITVRHEIRKLFLVSDNAAFNRLYELVGQDGLAASLAAPALPKRASSIGCRRRARAEENRRYPRIDLVGDGFVHTLPERTSAPLAAPPPMPGLRSGPPTSRATSASTEPMDFAAKNRVSLAELQRGLCIGRAPRRRLRRPGEPSRSPTPTARCCSRR